MITVPFSYGTRSGEHVFMDMDSVLALRLYFAPCFHV